MLLRRLATTVLRRGANDGGVLAAVRAEIAHELSSSHSSSPPSLQLQSTTIASSHSSPPNPNPAPLARSLTSPSLSQDIPDFSSVSDAPRWQEVLLRRRDAPEEMKVTVALLTLILLLFVTTRLLETLEKTSMKGRSSEIF
ncbi:hypothetical protein E2562_034229 [Oryza meyeriana var. granulata]|uniref:Uncharacterized protein n=1 Tax=Oryza meyeriana var. granulata TaxID=110450 RepID=A0A6G1CAE7_9ORYZ|nr:hypothetical protein E2562_034229 [Oryza meyeriana var. granulata]